MKFPNAAKGVKKIFTAEILNLIGTIFLIVAAIVIAAGVVGAVGVAGGSNISANEDAMALMGGGLLVAGIFAAVWMILSIIAFIMNLVGVINASRDEQNFKTALLFLIVGIVTSILSGFFYNNGTVSSLLYTLHGLFSMFVFVFVIAGIVKIADRMNRGDVSAKGTNVLKLVIVISILSLIANLIAAFMGGMVASVTASIIFIVALVLSLVQYFMYLSFLSKAKKMLAQAQ